MISGISQENVNSVFSILGSMKKEQEESPNKATPDSSVSSLLRPTKKEQKEEDSLAFVVRSLRKKEEQENPVLAMLRAVQRGLSRKVYSAGREESKYISAAKEAFTDQAQMELLSHEAIADAMKESIDEIKDNIEQKAEESTVPKDENGQPIEGLPTENAGEATPMPEISGSNPASAPVPEVSAAQDPDVDQVSFLTSGIISSFSPLSQSINISV